MIENPPSAAVDSASAVRPARSTGERLEALRRFHLGDRSAPALPAPDDLAPAAAAALGELAGAAGWPLVVESGAPAGQPFVRPARADEPDDLPRLAAGRAAVLELATFAARRRLASAHAGFAETARQLVALADRLLEADRERRPVAAPERAQRLGSLGARLFDPASVAEVVARRRAGAPLADERRRRLEAARGRLAGFAVLGASPIWILPAELEASLPAALDAPTRAAAEPCAAAIAEFDEQAAALAPLVAAARLVRLEAAGELDPERHRAALDRLDARGFDAAELALVPPVLALVRFADLAGPALAAASRLLLSGRPVQLLVLADERDDAREGVRFEPALVALGHREAFVQQGSLARPVELADGFERAFAAARPGLHVVDAPSEMPSSAGSTPPWVVAAARLAGRSAPLFRYEPGAGASWARRIDLAGNPEPLADWPRLPLDATAPAAPAAEVAPFTAADAALLDPARRVELALADVDGDELVPLADWLDLEPREAAGRLPFIVARRPGGETLRLVVARPLAFATRDRRAFWRTLSELAGVRSEPVEQAARSARREAEERAAGDLESLAAAHRAELDRVRAESAASVVERLVGGLLRVEGTGPGGGAPGR